MSCRPQSYSKRYVVFSQCIGINVIWIRFIEAESAMRKKNTAFSVSMVSFAGITLPYRVMVRKATGVAS